MATNLQASNIADALVTSLNELGRLKFTDLMSDYQNTIALKRIMKKKKMTIESGPEVQFNIITNHNNSARHVGLGYVSRVDIPNVMTVGKMPWRHTTWNWATERRLVAMNSGKSKIVDIAQTQRMAAFGSAILLFERTLWRCPSLTDFDNNPVGIPYFVVKSNTAFDTTTFGFNGSVPSGYTLVANLDPTLLTRWKNYAEQYTDVTKDDLIAKMRRAQYYTDFKPLVDDMPVYNLGDDYGIYSNYAAISNLVQILESQNENLGTDIAPMEGKAVFMRTPITPVKELDADSTNPFYMINWGELGAMGLQGEWMYEQHFPSNPTQPTISMTNTDCTWNLWCRNRRRQAVLATDRSPSPATAAARPNCPRASNARRWPSRSRSAPWAWTVTTSGFRRKRASCLVTKGNPSIDGLLGMDALFSNGVDRWPRICKPRTSPTPSSRR